MFILILIIITSFFVSNFYIRSLIVFMSKTEFQQIDKNNKASDVIKITYKYRFWSKILLSYVVPIQQIYILRLSYYILYIIFKFFTLIKFNETLKKLKDF